MPGYYLYLWLWAQLFGTGEWAMRLANAPWAALFTTSLSWGAEFVFPIRRTWLIACLSPFMWFYMNEARPYAMLMAISMVTSVAVLAYVRDPQRFEVAPWWSMVSLLALWFSHMLAITLGTSLLILLFMLRSVPVKRFARQWFLPVVTTLPFYLCLAFYYLKTLISGKGGMLEKPGPANLAFAAYEFLGFGGLGAPRNVLRQHPSYSTLLPYCATLTLGVLAIGSITVVLLLRLRHSRERRTIVGLSFALVAGILTTFTLSYATHFRLLGRHLSSFFAMSVLLMLIGLLPDSGQPYPKVVLGTLLLLGIAWSVSDFRQRLLLSYQKEDYRDAAWFAQRALVRGEPVLWFADNETARYYGLQTTQGFTKGTIASKLPKEAVFGVCSPETLGQSLHDYGSVLVVMSDREDIFDPGGACRRILNSLNSKRAENRFPGFEIWQITAAENVALPF
jgi:hypothetical protein